MNLKRKVKKISYCCKFQLTRLRNSLHQNNHHRLVFLEMQDLPPNRRIIQIIRCLTENGYFCLVHIPVRQFLHMDTIGLKIYKEKNIKCVSCDAYHNADIIISDHIERFKNCADKHLLQIIYNCFKQQDDFTIFFPIAFHPEYLYFLNEQMLMKRNLQEQRLVKVIFVGNVDQDYNSSLTKKIFNINTRKELFSAASDKALPVYEPDTLSNFLQQMNEGNLKDKIVLIDIQKFKIPSSEYFNVLLKTDFFIFMPGYIQPFCHNQIEAMASGAVPITQFPDIFNPPLVHKKTAVVFDSASDLIHLLAEINTIPQEEIFYLRQNIVKYYVDNYGFKSVCEKIINPHYKKICICAGDYSMQL